MTVFHESKWPAGSGAEVSRRGLLTMAGFFSTGGILFFAGKGDSFFHPVKLSRIQARGAGPQGKKEMRIQIRAPWAEEVLFPRVGALLETGKARRTKKGFRRA